MGRAFSDYDLFCESKADQQALEDFLSTATGGLLIGALRERALLVVSAPGTPQDGARAIVEELLNLTASRRDLVDLAAAKKQASPSGMPRLHRPTAPKSSPRATPPPTSTPLP